MSTTTDSNRPGATAIGVNKNAHKTYTDTRPSTRPQGQSAQDLDAPAVQHAENHDDAPSDVPGPDNSSAQVDTLRKQAKPVFNRGPSMIDFTAVTSAGPTPAGEVAPAGSYFDGSRLRESHLPDQDEEQQKQQQQQLEGGTMRRNRRQTVTEADSELPRHT